MKFKTKKIVDLIRSALLSPVVTENPMDEALKKKEKIPEEFCSGLLAEDEPKPDPYWLQIFFSFAPEEARRQPDWRHCGVLGPLLANICPGASKHLLA
jgi:hypothetical protein